MNKYDVILFKHNITGILHWFTCYADESCPNTMCSPGKGNLINHFDWVRDTIFILTKILCSLCLHPCIFKIRSQPENKYFACHLRKSCIYKHSYTYIYQNIKVTLVNERIIHYVEGVFSKLNNLEMRRCSILLLFKWIENNLYCFKSPTLDNMFKAKGTREKVTVEGGENVIEWKERCNDILGVIQFISNLYICINLK